MDERLTRTELELDEEGTRVSLTIVDTPGFGDQVDNDARLDCLIVETYPMLIWIST